MLRASSPQQLAGLVSHGSVVTIGNFDGVHLGHQHLLRTTVNRAHSLKLPAIAITFEPHPLHFFMGNAAPPLLMPLESKLAHIQQLGLDAILVLPFTREVATRSSEDFVYHMLATALQARHLVIGYDYAFGKGRGGNAALLTSLGKQYGFSVEQLQAVTYNGTIISSTAIREALAQGAVEQAHHFLGTPHTIAGKIVHGKGRGGSLLGFPTANLKVHPDTCLPHEGVYAVQATLEPAPTLCEQSQHEYNDLCKNHCLPTALTNAPTLEHIGSFALQGVASVGTNPTFSDGFLRTEVHLLDFSADIYGATLLVSFLARIRNQQTFAGPKALVEQIHTDIADARKQFAVFA